MNMLKEKRENCAKIMEMDEVNTHFQKTDEHRVTYESGGGTTQVHRYTV